MRLVSLMMALVLVLGVSLAVSAGESKAERFTGTITKVADGSITVVAKTEGGEDKTVTLKVDDKTKITVPGTETVTAENGETRPKMVEGKASDLKVDQKVTLAYDKDSMTVLRLYVMPAAKPVAPKKAE